MTRAKGSTLFTGDPAADAAVPPSGVTGHLTILAAAAMALLAVLALMLALAGGRLAERWSAALEGVATVEVAVAADTERAAAVLRQTPGVMAVRALDEAAMRDLLAQWVADPVILEGLDMPILLEVSEASDLDHGALRARLQAEVPGAVYHEHDVAGAWVPAAAGRLRDLAIGLLAVTFAVNAVMTTLAARASLAMNGQVIETLRQLGAQDSYVARAFVRRFTLRGFFGAILGTALGLVMVLVVPQGAAGALLAGLRPTSPLGWSSALAIPPLTGLMAFLATRRAAFRVLTRIR